MGYEIVIIHFFQFELKAIQIYTFFKFNYFRFVPIGKLSGGHSSSITTMLVDENFIITGSKDHYVKIFEINQNNYNRFSNNNNGFDDEQTTNTNSLFSESLMSTNELSFVNNSINKTNQTFSISSKYTLSPPHYDGVQSLCRFDNYLFSCSRDMCIKKWSMNDFQCKQVNHAFINFFY